MLTGPPHSGKSTTLNYIFRKWKNPVYELRTHYVIEESAIRLIEWLNDSCGLDGFAAWRKQYNAAWQALVAVKQLDEERCFAMEHNDVFIDSSPYDCVAFVEAYGGIPDDYLLTLCAGKKYDLVFYHELIQPFDERAGSGRLQSVEDCLRIGEAQRQVYTRNGMPPITLPPVSVQERMKMIQQHVEKWERDALAKQTAAG